MEQLRPFRCCLRTDRPPRIYLTPSFQAVSPASRFPVFQEVSFVPMSILDSQSKTESLPVYRLIILGSGPAGLTAAL